MSDAIHIHKIYGGESEGVRTKKERENLHKSFDYDNYVKAFGRWAAFYGFLIGAGLGPAWIYLATYREAPIEGKMLALLALLFGTALGGVVGTVAIWVRAAEYRELIVEYQLDEFAPPVPQTPGEAAERKARLNGEDYVLERQEKTVAYAGHQFTFTGNQLDAMLGWYKEGHQKIRRDASPEGPALSSIGIRGADYTRATMVLKGRQLIDEQMQWTNKGIHWLETE